MNLTSLLETLSELKVLVVGDLMIDRYLWGKVERISPEAPVPVVEVSKEESRLGGAANVGLNLHSLGAKPYLCGAMGTDRGGAELRTLFAEALFDTSLLLIDETRKTTTKTRVIGNRQQMLRVDWEDRHLLSSEIESRLVELIMPRLAEFDAIIFQDYDKGLLNERIIQTIMRKANRLKIPTVVDPKFKNFHHFRDAFLFKPNLKELNEAVGTRLEKSDLEGIRAAVGELRKTMPHQHTLVTLSEWGVVVIDPELKLVHIPAHSRKIIDVSGAGDTVISVIAVAIAGGLSVTEGAALANLAGGLVCEEVGVVPVNREQWEQEAQQLSV